MACEEGSAARRLILVVAGFLLWSAAFVVLYAAQALGCHFGLDGTMVLGMSAHRIVLAVIFCGALAGAVFITFRAARLLRQAHGTLPLFFGRLGLWANVAACGTIAGTFVPLFFLTTC